MDIEKLSLLIKESDSWIIFTRNDNGGEVKVCAFSPDYEKAIVVLALWFRNDKERFELLKKVIESEK